MICYVCVPFMQVNTAIELFGIADNLLCLSCRRRLRNGGLLFSVISGIAREVESRASSW
jgi:hypothetical protein